MRLDTSVFGYTKALDLAEQALALFGEPLS